MPTLTESTSKFTVNEDLTKHHPSDREKMLLWIQENQVACRHTTFKKIAEISLISGMNTQQKTNCLADLVHNQYLLIKLHSKSNKSKKTIYINYLHKNLPQSVKDNATDKEVADAKRVLGEESIKENQKILARQPATQKADVDIPVTPNILKQGLSLTLNINFNITKEQ